MSILEDLEKASALQIPRDEDLGQEEGVSRCAGLRLASHSFSSAVLKHLVIDLLCIVTFLGIRVIQKCKKKNQKRDVVFYHF